MTEKGEARRVDRIAEGFPHITPAPPPQKKISD